MWQLHPNKISMDNWQDDLSCRPTHSTIVHADAFVKPDGPSAAGGCTLHGHFPPKTTVCVFDIHNPEVCCRLILCFFVDCFSHYLC